MPLAEADVAPGIGEVVERWRVETLLGEGGTARVWRVRHVDLGTVAALKVLAVDHPTLRDRLAREGRLQASLKHPAVVAVRDVLEVDGRPALLMDFVAGRSLEALWSHDLDPQRALALLRQVAEGLAHAHERGVVHRDLTPANVLVEGEQARVLDFGIARCLDDGDARVTRAGLALGTPRWMAPEQLRSARDVDARADVFALGLLMYRALAGRPALPAEDPFATLAAGLEPPPGPPELVTLVQACLALDRVDRPADAGEVLARWPGSPGAATPAGRDSATGPALRVEASHAARTKALVVDQAGAGHVVDLVVELRAGSGQIEAVGDVARDAQVAAQLAIAAALGPAAAAWDARWSVGAGPRLHGTSLGLAVAVAAVAASRRRQVPEQVAFTGGVELDGRITSVAGLPAKRRAAGELDVWDPERSPQLAEVLSALDLAPPRRRLRWAALAVPVLVAGLGVLASLDLPLQHRLLAATAGTLTPDSTAVLGIGPDVERRSLRAVHAERIDALVHAGATAIVLDLALTAETEHDHGIAEAMTRAALAGVPVMVPVRMAEGVPIEPGSPAVRQAASLAVVGFRREAWFGSVVAAPVLRRDAAGQRWWHAAPLAAAAHLHAEPRLDGDELITGGARNAVAGEQVRLAPVEAPVVQDYDAPESWDVAGRVVVVGVVGGTDDLHSTPAGARYGAELQAALVETLLHEAAPRPVGAGWDALAAGLVALGTTLLRPSRTALLVPAGALAVVAALASGGWVAGLGSLVVAGVVGWWVGR